MFQNYPRAACPPLANSGVAVEIRFGERRKKCDYGKEDTGNHRLQLGVRLLAAGGHGSGTAGVQAGAGGGGLSGAR